MATMYDSVDPSQIPADAAIVAGYIDGRYAWTQADWDRFPNAQHVRIAVFASTDDGEVLDVESGDATPDEAPGWVTKRRFAGVKPTIYTSLSMVPVVAEAMTKVGVPQPFYWVADWTGQSHLVPNSVATQYANPPGSGGPWDLSVTNGTWPAAAPPKPSPPTTNGETVSVTLPVLSEAPTKKPYVATVQTLLNTHSAWLHVDGIFGPQTNSAVQHFQTFWKLTVDGIVGQQTWTTLLAFSGAA